ncbi:hypothetical protein INR49_003632 [Caranx melampygus]|nr:hypothetical protein INR49_003632 [Caranx melampygus]
MKPMRMTTNQHGGVGDTEQGVVQEALQHRCVHMEVCGKVLGGDGRPADEPSQTLTHGQCLGQLPGRGERIIQKGRACCYDLILNQL